MNYQRIHDAIIDRARNRTLQGYRERHHVIPRCLGGTDKSANLVELTAREHFVVHKLLVEIYPDNKSLHDAVWCMIHLVNENHIRDYVVSNREYEYFKVIRSENMSKLQQGHIVSKLTRDKISKTLTGRQLSDETKQKISSSRKLKKLGGSKPGFKRTVITCPYCNKSGGNSQITRWHFDNCKFKN